MFEVCGSCLRQAGIVVIVKHLWRVAVEAMLDNRECKAALQGRLKMAARPFDFKQIRYPQTDTQARAPTHVR